MPEFKYSSKIDAPVEDVFAWHEREGAFQRLTPPWEKVKIIEKSGGIRDGDRVVVSTQIGPAKVKWTAEHCDYEQNKQFRDIQISGPFAHWDHTHRFKPAGSDACILEDHVKYELPLGPIGATLGAAFTKAKLNRLFEYRHNITRQDLAAHTRYKGDKTMTILITGATGMVGSALEPFLRGGGHDINRLVRTKQSRDCCDFFWDPYAEELDEAALNGVDAVVHLSGENIAGRWTESKKAKIRESRVLSTKFLSKTISNLENPPKVLVCASAIGYYGDRGDEVLTESSKFGTGFLADVTREWEAATTPASVKGIRVVNIRIGVVLSPAGGALAKMLTPFKLGGGGIIGNGKQYWSWISLDDVIGVIHHAIMNESLSGPVNTVSPNPVTNQEFTKILGKLLSRPTFVPMPAFAAKLAFGEMGDTLLLSSARVQPAKLEKSGYEFRTPDLEGALRHVLGK